MNKLRLTLERILSLDVPEGTDFEVIVVDNGSSDDTASLCSQLSASSSGRLKRVYLPTHGLSRAGNAGFAAAHGTIIAYLDDDVLPKRDWLTVVCNEFRSDPGLGAISGRVELYNPADLSMAVRQNQERIEFRLIEHAFTLFIGCNLAIRRTLIERVGLFDSDIGTGSRFGSAGDSDFFYRAWKGGEKLVYVPSLFVQHDHGRRGREAKLKTSRDYIIGRAAFYAKHILKGDSDIVRPFYWEIRDAIRSMINPSDDLGWRHLAWLLSGFLGYSLSRVLRLRIPFRHAGLSARA